MQKLKSVLAFAAILAISTAPLLAQRASPHETTSKVIDRCRVTITYGRPYTKNRKIWGGLVPYDKIWRTGADEATLLITEKPLELGGFEVPAAYSIYTLPAADGSAKLILNKQLGQWGLTYNEGQDLGRVDLKKADLDAPVDQFTMMVDKGASGGGVIKMSWEKTEYSVPFTVKK